MDTATASENGSAVSGKAGRVELICAVIFALCNVALPIAFGELYPFTVAPMFRGHPQLYCSYRVTDHNGKELALHKFALQRNYDGNPVGLGAGIKPMPSLDTFGHEPSTEELRSHVSKVLNEKFPKLSYVDVRQIVVGPTNNGSVGEIRQKSIRVFQHDSQLSR